MRRTNQQCRLWSVIVNKIKTFTLSRTCYWKKLLLVNYSCMLHYVNQNLSTIQSLDNVMQSSMYMIIAYTVGLYYLKLARCRWRLVPCYARAGHIFSVGSYFLVCELFCQCCCSVHFEGYLLRKQHAMVIQ